MDEPMDYRVTIILHQIRRVIGNACRNYELENRINPNIRLELNSCLQNLARIRANISDGTFNELSNAINGLLLLTRSGCNTTVGPYLANRVNLGLGRPVVSITRNQLELFLNENYTVKQMARRLKCSESTINKRLSEENLKIRSKYNNINDNELKEIMKQICYDHPHCGAEMMWGYLRGKDLTIQRKRVRSLLREIDPIGTATRWCNSITRRTYSVPTPNALWHIDAHLKLVRWGFVIHGCIDGYSRLIIYLSCKISIQAQPVLELFLEAVKNHGIPSRVRSDHGYENSFVALFMNLIRGLGRGSHITGRSVHNQRIERLWLDVYKEVVNKVCKELYELEDSKLLDMDNNQHRYLIQLIYLDYINNLLKSFVSGWNFHKLSSEKRRSPRQIWIDGILDNINSEHTAILEIFQNNEDILQRTQEALQNVNIDVNQLDPSMPLESSLHKEPNPYTEEKHQEIENVIETNLYCKEKFISCLNIISNNNNIL